MEFSESHRIIWMDQYIGQEHECQGLKYTFRSNLDRNARQADDMDAMICSLEDNAAPFIFVSNEEKAINAIKQHFDKQIIFISSGSLGRPIIPTITSTYPNVYSYYIFCALEAEYFDLFMDHQPWLKVLSHEVDLLVRLLRDISAELMRLGRTYMDVDDPERAKIYFDRAVRLEEAANRADTVNGRFFENLRLLNGHGDKIGLIPEADAMIAERNASCAMDLDDPVDVREVIAEQVNPMYNPPDSPIGREEA